MRIRDSSIFPLTLEIQHTQGLPEHCEFMVRDWRLETLAFTVVRNQDTTEIKTKISLPNKIMIEIRSDNLSDQLHLRHWDLAGISVQKDKLLQCLEYRHGSVDRSHDPWLNVPAKKTLTWTAPCLVILDLFNPNPFAWHLYIGNKIQFR